MKKLLAATALFCVSCTHTIRTMAPYKESVAPYKEHLLLTTADTFLIFSSEGRYSCDFSEGASLTVKCVPLAIEF